MSVDPLDLADVMDRVQDDVDLLLELLDIFVEDYEKKRPRLEKSINDKDFGQTHSLAHSLKGAASNIGAKPLFETFVKLDEMAKNNDLNQAATVLAAMTQRFNHLKRRIATLKTEFKR